MAHADRTGSTLPVRWLSRGGSALALALALVSALGSTANSQPAASAPAAPKAGAESKAGRAAQALRAWVEKRGGVLGGEVRDLDTGELLAEVNAKRPLNPASAQKVFTAAVALDVLGPSYEFQTGLFGKLEGDQVQNLVLRGHGDPSLSYADLVRLAQAARQLGLARVRGHVLVDQSYFDEKFVPPAFEQQPEEWAAFRAPISAVSVDQNAVTLNGAPTREGQVARLWYTPPGVVASNGEVGTRAAGSGQGIQWTLRQAGPTLKSEVGGHVPEGQPRLRFVRRMDDPRLNPGKALVHALEQAGVKVQGEVKLGGAEEKTRLTYVSSAPLSSLLHRVGKYSDNFYAETIFKGLAADAEDLPATSAGGARRMKRWLDEQKVPSEALKIQNGSGLFDANRLTAHSLVSVLGSVYSKPAIRSEFVSQLAIGGVDGTLKARFRDPHQRSRIRAKTGTLNNVDVLAGYVLRESGRAPVAFAFVVNGISRQHPQVRAEIDRAVASLLDE